MKIFQVMTAVFAVAAATAAGFPAAADPPASPDPSGHPVPEINVNVGPGLKQISIQIGCEGQSQSFQYAPPGSGTVQKNFQLGPSNSNVQVSLGEGNTQINRQKAKPKGGWDCP
jgi:hypothetical protein